MKLAANICPKFMVEVVVGFLVNFERSIKLELCPVLFILFKLSWPIIAYSQIPLTNASGYPKSPCGKLTRKRNTRIGRRTEKELFPVDGSFQFKLIYSHVVRQSYRNPLQMKLFNSNSFRHSALGW